MLIRPLSTIPEFERVYALEQEVWGYIDASDSVPVPILVVSAKVGGLVLGAFDGERLAGFAYSVPGYREGRTYQWSHMLGVAKAYRNTGLGWQLKLEQRRLTILSGLELIEWTFDPLQALNAHFNFAKLGVVVRQYHENVYGDSTSVLHKGTPTDRFIAEWWLASPRVEERLSAATRRDLPRREPQAVEVGEHVNEVCEGGRWPRPGRAHLAFDAPTLTVMIPMGFTEMQIQDPALALAWRLATREIFESYLRRGYQVTGFALQRERGLGGYALTR